MIDASTKVPSGLLNGNYFDFGDFEECYGIKNKNIYGKYCLGTYPISSVGSGNQVLKLNLTQHNQVARYRYTAIIIKKKIDCRNTSSAQTFRIRPKLFRNSLCCLRSSYTESRGNSRVGNVY